MAGPQPPPLPAGRQPPPPPPRRVLLAQAQAGAAVVSADAMRQTASSEGEPKASESSVTRFFGAARDSLGQRPLRRPGRASARRGRAPAERAARSLGRTRGQPEPPRPVSAELVPAPPSARDGAAALLHERQCRRCEPGRRSTRRSSSGSTRRRATAATARAQRERRGRVDRARHRARVGAAALGASRGRSCCREGRRSR